MNKEEVLKKAIEKAVRNGWYKPDEEEWPSITVEEYYEPDYFYEGEGWIVRCRRKTQSGRWLEKKFNIEKEDFSIFSHKCAIAFWKDGELEIKLSSSVTNLRSGQVEFWSDRPFAPWQYHLQIMVLSENPILYLEQFINE